MNPVQLSRYAMKRLQHRLPLKVLAFLLAVLLFVVADAERQANSESEKIDRAQMVELVVNGLDEGLAPANLPAAIEVRARGPLEEALPPGTKAAVNLSGRKAGECSAPISVNLPSGWTLVEIRPQVLNTVLEPLLSRTFVVTLVIPSGQTPPRVDFPLQCTIQGPASRVKQVRAVLGMYNAEGHSPVDVRLVPVDRDGQPVKNATVFPEWIRLNPVMD